MVIVGVAVWDWHHSSLTGYEDEAENTWEPIDNLDCEDKIQDFEKKQKDKVNLVSILYFDHILS